MARLYRSARPDAMATTSPSLRGRLAELLAQHRVAVAKHRTELPPDDQSVGEPPDRPPADAVRDAIDHARRLRIHPLEVVLVPPCFEWPRFLLVHEPCFLAE